MEAFWLTAQRKVVRCRPSGVGSGLGVLLEILTGKVQIKCPRELLLGHLDGDLLRGGRKLFTRGDMQRRVGDEKKYTKSDGQKTRASSA